MLANAAKALTVSIVLTAVPFSGDSILASPEYRAAEQRARRDLDGHGQEHAA
ncbi:hypothetical protein ACWGNN_31450 [Streptomyces sp. NPDC055817]